MIKKGCEIDKIIFGVMLALGIVQADRIAVIEVKGMSCPLCTVAIKKSLKKTPGVIKAKVRLNTRQATVRYRDDLDETALLKAIEKAGYRGKILRVVPAGKEEGEQR